MENAGICSRIMGEKSCFSKCPGNVQAWTFSEENVSWIMEFPIRTDPKLPACFQKYSGQKLSVHSTLRWKSSWTNLD